MSLKRKPPPGNVRRVACTGSNIRGVVTNKAGRLVQFESWMERKLILALDHDPTVQDFASQPERIEFRDSTGKLHTYVPDFIVWRTNGDVEIHEVGTARRQLRAEIYERSNAMRAICASRGWRFVIHTEFSLPTDTAVANLLALAHYRALAYADNEIWDSALEKLANGQRLGLDNLTKEIARQLNRTELTVLAALCHKICHGDLEIDLSRLIFARGRLASDTVIWLQPQEETHGQEIQTGAIQ